MADETQRIQVVIFDNDSVVTLAEFEQMHPADVEWREASMQTENGP